MGARAGAEGAGRGAGGASGTPGAGGAAGRSGGAAGTGAGGLAGAGRGGASAGGTSAGGTSGGLPFGNPAVPSTGCGKATTVTTGKKTITSSGQQRTYIIDVPTNYDMSKPYRLFYTSHWIGSTSEAVRDQNYYFLKPLAEADNQPAIFVAPQSDGSTWQEKDHALFDDILAFVKDNLCIDTTRVFATGFSFGGMITYSLSLNHQKDIRAAVGIAPANYNIYIPPKTHAPIAWMQTTGMSDTTCPWINGNSTTQGSKFIAIERGTDNGCMVPDTIPIWESGKHVCYDIPGCKAEYPTKVCTFNGPHTNINNDPGTNTNWIPQESWAFFKQF
jgi:poly(3-hydroxybutyrate) depolymerase